MVSQPFPGSRRKSPFGGMPVRGAVKTMRLPVSPLIPPGICGARFLRQQKAGVSFCARRWAAVPHHSRCARKNAETRDMGAAAEAQPISPELVLVSPELREHALRLLPALDPDALFAVPPRPLASPPRPPAPKPAPNVEHEWERPRLSLVEPEPTPPRLPVAVAVYATEALVLGAVRAAGLTAAITIVAFLLAR